MESINLKELSAYLPYEMQGTADFLPDTIFIVNSISFTWVKGYTKEGNNVPLGCNIKNFKPLLRPLSGLTKEIEVNGKKFVPIDIIRDFHFITNVKQLPYNFFERLLEWHFDCFNLIERGLAIDLNEI